MNLLRSLRGHGLACVLVVLCMSLGSLIQAADPPAPFMYQGYLEVDGAPANGAFDFIFVAYETSSSTTPLAPECVVGGVRVTDGVFNVELDFGTTIWDRFDPWIEIGVLETTKDADRAPYTMLSPRQHFLPTHTAYSARDAQTLSGYDSSDLRNASLINSGTLNTSRYSAYSDLTAESKVSAAPAADTIPVADGTGKLDAGWLPSTASGNQVVVTVPNPGALGYTAGSPVAYGAGSAQLPKFVAPLVGLTDFGQSSVFELIAVDESRAFFAYRDESDGNKGKACVVSVSGTALSFTTPEVFSSNAITDMQAVVLSPANSSSFRTAIVAYTDSSIGNHLLMRSIRFNNDETYVLGTPITVVAAATTEFELANMSRSQPVLAYADPLDSDHGKVKSYTYFQASGNVSQYASGTFNSAATDTIAIQMYSEYSGLLAYNDAATGDPAMLTIGHNWGSSTMNAGTPVTMSSLAMSDIEFVPLDSQMMILCDSREGYDSDTMYPVRVTGNSMSLGNETGRSGIATYAPIDHSRFVRACQGSSSVYVGCYATDGANIITTAETASYVMSTGNDALSIAVLGGSHVLLAYSSGPVKFALGQYAPPLGIVKTSSTYGAPVEVIVAGVADGLSDLVPGATYYINSSGNLTRDVGWAKMGRAISETELMIDIE
ncbi:hypothetical protein KQI84_08840 [bacterium]|nr:hypothetical protein [bacterium]